MQYMALCFYPNPSTGYARVAAASTCLAITGTTLIPTNTFLTLLHLTQSLNPLLCAVQHQCPEPGWAQDL